MSDDGDFQPSMNGFTIGGQMNGSTSSRGAGPPHLQALGRPPAGSPAQRPGLNLQLPAHVNGNGQEASQAGCSTSPLPRRNMNC